MKSTTEYRALINEATANLRHDIMSTLASRDTADQLRRDFEKLPTDPSLVAVGPYPTNPELAAAFNQGYDAAKRGVTQRTTAVESSGSGEYARGYAAAIDRTTQIAVSAVAPEPTVENTEVWARPGSVAVIKLDQLDNETSVINSKTLRLLLARGNYQFISAHQKKDTE